MTTYNIDYSDPLRTGFSINPGEFNGPGGTGVAQTSLRLYGRGALEWGESVDENLVRIHENFAGATPPVYPVGGQLWLRQMLYVKVSSTFYRWNFTNSTWGTITVTTIAGSISGHTNGTSPGQYVYSTADAKLYRWDAPYKQAAASWLPRALTVQASAPTTQKPVQDLLFYDQYSTSWVTPRAATTGSGVPPTGSYDGQLYYDTATGILYIWNESEGEWQQILGPANAGGTDVASSGNIDMQNLYNVINIKTPLATDLDYAANVGYVHSYVTSQLGDTEADILAAVSASYVTKNVGSTMNGTYTLTGTMNGTNGSFATLNGTTLTSNSATLANATITTATVTNATVTNATVTNGTVNNLTLGGTANANSKRIVNLAYAIAGTDAASADFANAVGTSAIATANSYTNTYTNTHASLVNPSSVKNGDIRTNAGGVDIYYGGWRRVWPATYS